MEADILDIKINFFREDLKQGKNVCLKVTGNSMLPFIKSGETLVIAPADFAKVRVGEVVLSCVNGRPFCHRVFHKTSGYLLTKADAFIGFDPRVKKEDFLGKVIAKEKKGRRLGMDGLSARVGGIFISYVTLFSALFYPTLRRLRKIIRAALENTGKRQELVNEAAAKKLLFGLLAAPGRDKIGQFENCDISEEEFLKQVSGEAVEGIIFYHALTYGLKDRFPPRILQRLETGYLNNAGRNMFLIGRLKQVCEMFEKEKIPLLLLRGAGFLETVYPALGMRTMSDLDLMVLAKDKARAKEILKETGYTAYPGYPDLFIKDNVHIDLHADIPGNRCFGVWPANSGAGNKSFWPGSRPYCRMEFVRVPAVYDTILCCCTHLQEHSFEKLGWFMDIVFLIRNEKEKWSWPGLIRRAGEWGVERQLFYTLAYLKSNGLVCVPDEIISVFSELKLSWFEQKSLRLLVRGKRNALCGGMMRFFSLPGISAKIGFLRGVLSAKKNYSSDVVSSTLFFDRSIRFLRLGTDALKKIVEVISA